MSDNTMSHTSAPYTIGVISWTLADNYCGLVVLGIHEVISGLGGRLMIFQGLPGDVRTSTELVDGWISIIKTDEIDSILCHGKPCVTVAAVVEGAGTAAVLADNQGGAVAALEHLIAHGHRRIAFAGCRGSSDIDQRYASYCAILEAHGIPYDPALVLEASDDLVWGGRIAGELLVKAGLPCSAVFVATDENALGLMSVVQAAGYSIPEDLAVISFDNIVRAQYTTPPLTTVSQRLDMLGRTAAQTLLGMIAGQATPAIVEVPTSLVVRQSCGCSATTRIARVARPLLPEIAGQAWQEALAWELVRIALYPDLPAAGSGPTDICPGVAILIRGLEAVAQNQQPPAQDVLAAAWDEVLNLTFDQSVLYQIIERMGEAAALQLGVAPNSPAWQRVEGYLTAAQARFSQMQFARALGRVDFLAEHVQSNFEISMRLLGSKSGTVTDLAWLRRQPSIKWGYLGLWSELDGPDPQRLTVAGAYSSAGDVSSMVGRSYPASSFPLASLGEGLSIWPNHNDVVLVLPIRRRITESTGDMSPYAHAKDRIGVLALCVPPDQNLSSDKLLMWSMLLSSAVEREALLVSLARAKEVAEAANRLKTEFLSTMTHELRTPLNAILNFTRFMDNPAIGGRLNGQQRHFQERVLVNGNRLLALINHIMDLTALEEDRMELDLAPGELSPLLDEVLATGLSLAQEKALDLRLKLPDAVLPTLHIDRVRVQQVLENLLSNAVKFTETGSITIGVSRADEREVCVAIHDTGIGIPADKYSLVFESYRQIDGGLTRAYGGTGLGLAISKRFIELHNGRMWFESEPGVGTTFFFTLPIYQEA